MDKFRVNTVRGRMGIVGARRAGMPLLQKRVAAKVPTMKRRMPGMVSPIKGRDMLAGVKGRSASSLKSKMSSIGLRSKRPALMRKSPKMNLFRVNTVKDRMGLVRGRSNGLLANKIRDGKPIVIGTKALESNLLKRISREDRLARPIVVRGTPGVPLIGNAMSKNLLNSKVHLGVSMPSLKTGMRRSPSNMSTLQGKLSAAKGMKMGGPMNKMPLKRSFGINDKKMIGKGGLRFDLMQRKLNASYKE